MKHLFTIALALTLPLIASAQAQINTKKVRISDFPDKTTKIVLSGNSMTDGLLQSEVKNSWTASPYEFCTAEEFDILKTNPDYYFLMTVSGRYRKETEPGIELLTLVKGSPEAAENLDKMLEVATIPFRPIGSDGREYTLLPLLLKALQHSALDATVNDANGYLGLGVYVTNLPKTKTMEVFLAREDLCPQIGDKEIGSYIKDGISLVEADDEEDFIIDEAPNTVVSYSVAPQEAQSGSYSYKMLLGTEDGAVYYFKKHKISPKYGAGFLPEDLKKIASVR